MFVVAPDNVAEIATAHDRLENPRARGRGARLLKGVCIFELTTAAVPVQPAARDALWPLATAHAESIGVLRP